MHFLKGTIMPQAKEMPIQQKISMNFLTENVPSLLTARYTIWHLRIVNPKTHTVTVYDFDGTHTTGQYNFDQPIQVGIYFDLTIRLSSLIS